MMILQYSKKTLRYYWFIILHMSAEWQAIPFCLLFSKTCGSIFPVDRKKPNEFFVELINWVFRRLLLACLPCVKTHACSYAGIYILSLCV